MKTFGSISLEIDKMAGLRMRNEHGHIVNVRSWDHSHTPDIHGVLHSPEEDLIWEGMLWTRNELDRIFRPHTSGGAPIPYAQRKGALGTPTTAGVLRLASHNGNEFLLQQCDGGEAIQKVLANIQRKKQVVLKARIGDRELHSILLDEERDHSKLRRLERLEIEEA